jgi:hypothetical protein
VKITKISVWIADVPAEIRTEHLPNISLDHHLYAILLTMVVPVNTVMNLQVPWKVGDFVAFRAII